jgi:hypothetical protein
MVDAEVVDRQHVRVLELRAHLRLVDEAARDARRADQRLHRHPPIEVAIEHW